MKRKKKFKKPNRFIYTVYRLLAKLIAKVKLNLKVVKNELKNKKGPFLLLANHESMIDFVSIGGYLPNMSVVISSSFYNTLPIARLMNLVGAIPKQQFQTTPNDLKKMKEVVANGVPLAIYPAGLMSEQGLATPIPESTGKFIKWLNQDVYVAKIKGTYLSKPKWSKVWRKGRATLEVYKLIDKEKLANLENEQVFELIDRELYFNSYKDQEQNQIKYKKGNDIVGLESVLYKCPKCQKEFTMSVNGKDRMTCTECGNSCVADHYGFLNKTGESDLIFKHPSDWAKSIEDDLYNQILTNDNFELKDACQVHLLNKKKHKYQYAGDAKIVLNKEQLILEGTINGQKTRKEYLSSQYITLPFTPNSHFEIQDGEVSYRIKLKNAIATTKWIWSLKSLYKIENIKKQLKENYKAERAM